MRMHAEIRCPCAFAFLGDLELLLLLIPCGQLAGRDDAVEHLALTDVCVRRTAFQGSSRLAEAASAGGGEQENLLAGEVAALQKCVDDRGCNIPPDGERQKNGVIVCQITARCSDFRTGGLVPQW